MVNSFHNYHSEENNLFNICAISEDNIIEGIELEGKRFILGIQWHPEISYDFDDNSKLTDSNNASLTDLAQDINDADSYLNLTKNYFEKIHS